MKISIIIPIYNAETSVGITIESIINQSFTDWELLLINDGSTDKSKYICQSFVEKDCRISLYSQDNCGVSVARNIGIEHAIGDFIVFVDSDDEIAPEYLQGLLDDYIHNNSPDIVIQGYVKENKKNHYTKNRLVEYIKYYDLSDDKFFFQDINILIYGYPFSKLFLTDIILKNNLRFNAKLTFCEDLVFFMQYLYFSNSICVSNKTNYIYHYTANSLSVRYHPFLSECNSYFAIKNSYKKLLQKKGVKEALAMILLMNNYQISITRPLISLVLIEKGFITHKTKMIRVLDDEYFQILRNFFKTATKYQFISIFCNRRLWGILAILLYVRYGSNPKIKRFFRKID